MNQGDQSRHLHGVPSDDLPTPENSSSGGGNGGGTDARLRAIEARLIEVEKDVVVVKTKLEPLATREDIANMQVRMLTWFIGTVIIVAGLWVSLNKMFSS